MKTFLISVPTQYRDDARTVIVSLGADIVDVRPSSERRNAVFTVQGQGLTVESLHAAINAAVRVGFKVVEVLQ